jgi:membrane protein required for colicin V production
MESLTPLDAGVILIMLIGMARGAYIGMIRESLSIASLALACFAVKFGRVPLGDWMTEITKGEVGSVLAPWLAGTTIVILTILLIGIVARVLKRSVQFVGLGWADRIGGGALGMAEGGLVAALVVAGVLLALGNEHPMMYKSQSVEAVGVLQRYVAKNIGTIELPDVAAEPN